MADTPCLPVFLCALLACVAGRFVHFSYVGCYVDYIDGTRDMKGNNLNSPDEMSLEICSAICSLDSFLYFGVQFSSQCFCDSSFGSQGKGEESECNRPCSGNSSQICGGGGRNAVYALSYPDWNSYTVVKPSNLTVTFKRTRYNLVAAQSDADCLLQCSARADCQAAVFSKRLLACRLLDFVYPPASLTGPDWTL
uniref:WSC domain-containing protein n=1 Tax=Macrostomum lignano TaxID=282301 RepID=A0A1I8J6X7_9PLAT